MPKDIAIIGFRLHHDASKKVNDARGCRRHRLSPPPYSHPKAEGRQTPPQCGRAHRHPAQAATRRGGSRGSNRAKGGRHPRLETGGRQPTPTRTARDEDPPQASGGATTAPGHPNHWGRSTPGWAAMAATAGPTPPEGCGTGGHPRHSTSWVVAATARNHGPWQPEAQHSEARGQRGRRRRAPLEPPGAQHLGHAAAVEVAPTWARQQIWPAGSQIQQGEGWIWLRLLAAAKGDEVAGREEGGGGKREKRAWGGGLSRLRLSRGPPPPEAAWGGRADGGGGRPPCRLGE
jgi:hypothetical protein